MKKFKKVLAMLLAMIMVLGMGVTALATGSDDGDGGSGTEETNETTTEVTAPKEGDVGTITVRGVEEGATVTAYQVVKAVYNAYGFEKYAVVSGVDITEATAPKSEEVTAIAADSETLKGLTKLELSRDTESDDVIYTTNQASPGYWIVIVEGTGAVIYNPMLAGVYYRVSGSDNTLADGEVNAATKWDLEGADMYAKSSEVSVKKEIDGSNGNDKGNSLSVGDSVDYKITTTIPDYSAEYTEDVTFTVTDTLSEGLDAPEAKDVTITVGGIEVEKGKDTVEVSVANNVITITFDSAYIKANGGKAVEITYSAKLNEKAAVNFDPNTNSAVLEYTHKPGEDGTTKTKPEKTYTYTFSIGAQLDAVGKVTDKKLAVVQKVDESGNVISTDETVIEATTNKYVIAGSGATFELWRKKDDAESVVARATTGGDGSLVFTGLKEGTYYLVETVAPEGFTLDSTPKPVVIEAEYNSDGMLNKVVITIDGVVTGTYVAEYSDGTLSNVTVTDEKVTEITNTTISELPSTGGIGTTLFTIGGIILMVGAAGMYFVSKKKKA